MIDELPRDYRRNFSCFMGDWVLFSIAGAFASTTTVLPAFVGRLSDSPLLIGLISTIASGGWLLPQMLAASRIAHQPRKKPYLIGAASIGRIAYVILAVMLLTIARPDPTLLLVVFFVGYALFVVSDGVAYLAWFDMMSRAIPIRRRGRMIGISQFLSALLGMGAGVLVDYILGDRSPFAFPRNFGALFGLAVVFMALSLGADLGIREPPAAPARPPASLGHYLRSLTRVLREDRDFRRITIFRLLVGLSGVSTSFFVVYATKELGLPTGVAGVFLTAQIAGSLLASVTLSVLTDRKGSRITTIVEGALTVAPPALALLVAFTLSAHTSTFVIAYCVVFALVGAQANSMPLGHMTYLMEVSPPEHRTTYVGLCNTISGLLIAAPLVAGWFLDVTSYHALFAVTAVVAVPTVLLAIRMRDPRRTHPAAQPAATPARDG
jgi:MFS family permease